jgi:hypothetical protein
MMEEKHAEIFVSKLKTTPRRGACIWDSGDDR